MVLPVKIGDREATLGKQQLGLGKQQLTCYSHWIEKIKIKGKGANKKKNKISKQLSQCHKCAKSLFEQDFYSHCDFCLRDQTVAWPRTSSSCHAEELFVFFFVS